MDPLTISLVAGAASLLFQTHLHTDSFLETAQIISATVLFACVAFVLLYVANVIQVGLRNWQLGVNLLEDLDNCPDDTEATEEEVSHRVRRRQNVSLVARRVKLQMCGTPKYTDVNFQTAYKIAVAEMFKRTGGDHRISHISRDIDRILVMVFAPTADEVLARQVEASFPVRWRRRYGRAPSFL
jgi:hypothetical protein